VVLGVGMGFNRILLSNDLTVHHQHGGFPEDKLPWPLVRREAQKGVSEKETSDNVPGEQAGYYY
ncbi:MAG: hypothetical protein WBA88_20185, partial [Pseudaminobacter sp.]